MYMTFDVRLVLTLVSSANYYDKAIEKKKGMQCGYELEVYNDYQQRIELFLTCSWWQYGCDFVFKTE